LEIFFRSGDRGSRRVFRELYHEKDLGVVSRRVKGGRGMREGMTGLEGGKEGNEGWGLETESDRGRRREERGGEGGEK
jgi:hypothetical protein